MLHNRREIRAGATGRGGARPETLATIRQAAARHAVPAGLTGVPVKQGQPDAAGLYANPGGKPGLREWTGTEWSPYLQVDPASSGPGGGNGPARIWSPVTELEQQRQWDAVASRARGAGITFAALLGAEVVAAAVVLAVFIHDLGHHGHGDRAGWGLYWLGLGAILTFLAWLAREQRRKAAQAAKRTAGWISCRECGADSDRAAQVCARCGAPLLPLSSP